MGGVTFHNKVWQRPLVQYADPPLPPIQASGSASGVKGLASPVEAESIDPSGVLRLLEGRMDGGWMRRGEEHDAAEILEVGGKAVGRPFICLILDLDDGNRYGQAEGGPREGRGVNSPQQ
jgi:hypothetical protein